MTRVTNKIVPHRKCSVAFRVRVSLKLSFKILMISIYIVCRLVASCRHIIAIIRSRHSDGDLRGRDEISTLNLFKYIFMEHDIVKFSSHI